MARQFELIDTTRANQAVALSELEDARLAPDERRHEPIEAPPLPITVEDTGLSAKFLGYLLLRVIQVLGLETSPEISAYVKLHQSVVDKLLTGLKQQSLVEILGSVAANVPILRYGLTSAGREIATAAGKQCEYIGPTPVPLEAYQVQVAKQSISKERVTSHALACSLSHLVIQRQLIRKLGPAVNSARAMLLYGPSGNGKTSISESIGRAFTQHIYIPYCVEVDGQIIKIFDPTVHSPVDDSPALIGEDNGSVSLFKRKDDPRWVKCRRPVLIVGGELTLDMLDLDFDPISKYYEAPAQVKATGGVFIVDDFGRQLVRPKDLLNRWIVPLEKRVDYLTVHTGKKFEMPFDQLVIFSTNIPPNELMDAAQLRRVKYKLRIDPPQFSEYVKIFRRVCEDHQIEMPEGILSYLLNDFYPKTGSGCAAFHPIFIVEHAIATCRFEGMRPCLTLDLVKDALANLYIHDQDGDFTCQTPAGV